MKATVHYEEKFKISINKAFDLTLQWLKSQYKANIKESTSPTFILAKQGTMMTNTGHDPNWKKKISITFYNLDEKQTLIRVEATPLARNIFRVDKLKQSWFDGLFSNLFSLLQNYEKQIPESTLELDAKFCDYCKEQINKDAKFCPFCGVKIE
ncbi:MAG: zinc ribbon domain-containing protein [Promethearchaeota archaeon]